MNGLGGVTRTTRNLLVLAAALGFSALSAPARPPDTARVYSGPGRYEVLNVSSGKSLDSNLQDGRTVRQSAPSHGPNQQWDVEDAGNGYVRIKAAETGLVLDIEGGAARDGAAVILSRPSRSDSQLWKFEDAGEGRLNIISRLGKAIDMPNGSDDNGAVFKLRAPGNHTSEKFRFIRVSGPVAANPGTPEHERTARDEKSSYHLGFRLGVEDFKAQLRRTYARHKGEYDPQWEVAFIEGYYDGYDTGRADTGRMRVTEKDIYDSGSRMGQQDYRDGKRPDYTRYADRFDSRSEPFFRRGYEDGYFSSR